MRHLLTIALFASLTTQAATPLTWEHVKGSGEVMKRSITVDAFHGIVVNGSMDVIITKADVQSVEVEAQANILDLITTEVRDGAWIIETSKGYSTDKAFIVHIRVPSMDKVHINGSGDVKSADVFKSGKLDLAVSGSGDIVFATEAASVNVAIEGSGDIRIKGTSGTLNATIAGSGDVKASELTVTDMNVVIEGSGDVSANASGNVDVNVAGSGDVVLMKNPANVKKRIEGSGEVRVQQQ